MTREKKKGLTGIGIILLCMGMGYLSSYILYMYPSQEYWWVGFTVLLLVVGGFLLFTWGLMLLSCWMDTF